MSTCEQNTGPGVTVETDEADRRQNGFRGRPYDEDDRCIAQCRRLVASRYRDLGYYDKGDLVDDSGLPSPESWDQHSDYYWLPPAPDGDSRVLATSRLIRFSSGEEHGLPLLKHIDSLYPEAKKLIAEYSSDSPYSVVEISALAREKGMGENGDLYALGLYSMMFQDFLLRRASNANHETNTTDTELELWTMAISPALEKMFIDGFGEGVFTKAGEPLPYKGEDAIPYILEPARGFSRLIDNGLKDLHEGRLEDARFKQFLAESLVGDNQELLPQNLLDKLNEFGQGIIERTSLSYSDDDSLRDKKRRRIENLSTAVLLAYTGIRTAVVGQSDISGVDWRIFLGIELATTYPYIKCISNYLRSSPGKEGDDKTPNLKRFAYLGGAFLSFASPYLYVYKNPVSAIENSPIGSTIFGVMALAGVASMIKSSRQSKEA